jgi:hypothetical protein
MPLAPSPPSAARWPRRPQRLALAVNLLLVLALGIVIGIAATHRQDVASTAPTTAAPVVTPPAGPTGDGDPDQDQRARCVPRHGPARRRDHRPAEPEPA